MAFVQVVLILYLLFLLLLEEDREFVLFVEPNQVLQVDLLDPIPFGSLSFALLNSILSDFFQQSFGFGL